MFSNSEGPLLSSPKISLCRSLLVVQQNIILFFNSTNWRRIAGLGRASYDSIHANFIFKNFVSYKTVQLMVSQLKLPASKVLLKPEHV